METVELSFDEAMGTHLQRLDDLDAIARLWRRDGRLFSDDAQVAARVVGRLGWLRAAEAMRDRVGTLTSFARVVERQGYDRALVIGMGGCSLWPEVIGRHLKGKRGLELRVADSTHPEAVRAALSWASEGQPLFVVASKSGDTLETLTLYRIFRERFDDGRHFAAITDAGSPLQTLAREEGFREIFINPADIGGRFSAVSLFGLVPAVLAGVVIKDALQRVAQMAEDCQVTPAHLNPAAQLAAFMAAAHDSGRWHLRLGLGRDIRGFGAWVEQMIAESAGKDGKGLLPMAGRVPGVGPALAARMTHAVVVSLHTFRYPDDRFVDDDPDAVVPWHPLVMPDAMDLWTEVFRWEMATALLGVLLGINPFDEPDVAVAKAATQALLQGTALALAPAREVEIAKPADLEKVLADDLAAMAPDDHLAVLCFLSPEGGQQQKLDSLRGRLQDLTRAAVTVQFGPRYLHSTGQLHKGGPARGRFVVVHDFRARAGAGAPDVPVPGKPYTLGALIRAQAEADVMVLSQLGRHVTVAALT